MPPKRSNSSLEEPTEAQPITELDPILPLPAFGKFPGVKQGEGAEILANTKLMVVEMPYRVFYSLFEHVERKAEREYPKYKDRVDGLETYAASQVEAVAAFRSAFIGEIIPILSEEEAQKIRDKIAKKKAKKTVEANRPVHIPNVNGQPFTCPKCGQDEISGGTTFLKKKTKDGQKVWKCALCKHRWPRTSPGSPPESVSKGRKAPKSGASTPKAATGKQRPRKKPAKNA